MIRSLSILTLSLGIITSASTLANDVAIAIHGGAGTITKAKLTAQQEAEYRGVLKDAVLAGYKVLQEGLHGREAVKVAIMRLEDSPLFNAGKGAVYTYDEGHELDASIMEGENRQAGAISGVSGIKNPILLADAVLSESKHVFLSGKGAEAFAESLGMTLVPNAYFNTPQRYDSLKRAKQGIKDTQARLAPLDPDHKYGTVGAVVKDSLGNLVAGTSTGGMTAKRWGRIGDSPVIGAGTFADNKSCAVSATGHGEYFIRYNVAADICARVQYRGESAAEAAHTVIHDVLQPAGGGGGVIVIDKDATISMPFNTEGMYRASVDTDGKVTVAIYGETSATD